LSDAHQAEPAASLVSIKNRFGVEAAAVVFDDHLHMIVSLVDDDAYSRCRGVTPDIRQRLLQNTVEGAPDDVRQTFAMHLRHEVQVCHHPTFGLERFDQLPDGRVESELRQRRRTDFEGQALDRMVDVRDDFHELPELVRRTRRKRAET